VPLPAEATRRMTRLPDHEEHVVPSEAPRARGREATRALSRGRRSSYARASTLLTAIAAHRPPRAVGMPRAFRASAMARRDLASARWTSEIGRDGL
jgi:hypothetical protein